MYIRYTDIRNVKYPEKTYPTDAGIDFFIPVFDEKFRRDFLQNPSNEGCSFETRNDQDYTLKILPNHNAVIPSGIKVEIPYGHMGLFLNKSGVATKKDLLLGAQVIDCFTEETKIWTPEGEKTIFQLNISDIVFSTSENGIEKDVVDAIVNTGEQETITLSTHKGEITITSGTRVYTKYGIKYARDLKEGDEIIFCPNTTK